MQELKEQLEVIREQRLAAELETAMMDDEQTKVWCAESTVVLVLKLHVRWILAFGYIVTL